MNEQRKIEIVDIPSEATADQVAELLNKSCEGGYFLFSLCGWTGLPGISGRAIFKKLKEKATGNHKPADKDGKEAQALGIVHANPLEPLRALVARLKKAGIQRGKSWVQEKRATYREDEALAILMENPKAYESEILEKLARAGISRSRIWVQRQKIALANRSKQ